MSENGEVTIDKETFQNMAPDDQNWILFKTIQSQKAFCQKHIASVDGKINKLKARKKIDTGVASALGLLGGFLSGLLGKSISP